MLKSNNYFAGRSDHQGMTREGLLLNRLSYVAAEISALSRRIPERFQTQHYRSADQEHATNPMDQVSRTAFQFASQPTRADAVAGQKRAVHNEICDRKCKKLRNEGMAWVDELRKQGCEKNNGFGVCRRGEETLPPKGF